MANNEKRESDKQKRKRKEALRQKDETAFSFYLHASFFLFFLMSYTFLLFLYKNKYPLILNDEILPEVLFCCFALLVVSFGCLLLLSFWRFLARAFIAVIAGTAVAFIAGLLLPYNIGNYVAHYAPFLPRDILVQAADNGNLAVGVVAGLIFLVLLHMFKGGAMALLSMPVLAAIFLLFNSASKQQPVQRLTINADSRDEQKADNIVYLILSDLSGYNASVESWRALNAQTESPATSPDAPTFVPAFYKANKFTFYPSAYLRYTGRARNIGSALNPSLTEIGDDMFNRDDAAYYVSSPDSKVFIKRNELFDEWKKQGYRLNVYQTYPFDFCQGAGEKNVDFCESHPAPLGALYQTNLSTASRMMLLAGHWLYSTPFGKPFAAFVSKKMRTFINPSSIPLIGNPMSASLPVGQAQVLSRLRQDVLTAKGKNVFFAHLDLPHYPYVYDGNCQLKTDPTAWRSNVPYSEKREAGGELKRWQDYNRQLFCTYNQINYLIKDLESAKLADKTTIVIHGDKGSGIQKESLDMKAFEHFDLMLYRFKHIMTTTFAVYSPKNKKSKVVNEPCDIGTLVARNVLNKKDAVCRDPDFINYTKNEQDKSLAWLAEPIEDAYLKNAGDFDAKYAKWLENGGQAFIALSDEQLKQNGSTETGSTISFIAPPEMPVTPAPKPVVKEKTADFVPVPTETDEQVVPPPPPPPAEETSSIFDDLPKTDVPAPVETVPAADEKPKETVEFIADDLGDLPKPIVLPQIDPTMEDKWKSTDIKEGQKTTLEQVPDSVRQADNKANAAPVETVVEMPSDDLNVPDAPVAAPVNDVKLAPLPPVETVETPATVVPPPPPPAEPEVIAEQTTENALPPPPPPAEPEVLPPESTETAQAAAEAEAQAKTEAEAQAKAAAEAKAKAEAEAKAKAEAEAEAQAKAEAEAQAKAEAEAKARAEAIEKTKAEVAARAKARAQAEAEAQAKAEAEAKALAEAEAEERRLKTPPPPKNADELDITREIVTEHVNDDGEVETYIYIERRPNPKRFKKKPVQERELQQQDLTHETSTTVSTELKEEPVSEAPIAATAPAEKGAPVEKPTENVEEPPLEKAVVPAEKPKTEASKYVAPAVVERELSD